MNKVSEISTVLWALNFGDVPVNHPVLCICRVSHYPVLPGPGKIINPSKFNFFQSKILNRIVDKNILCGISNIQRYKLEKYNQESSFTQECVIFHFLSHITMFNLF